MFYELEVNGNTLLIDIIKNLSEDTTNLIIDDKASYMKDVGDGCKVYISRSEHSDSDKAIQAFAEDIKKCHLVKLSGEVLSQPIGEARIAELAEALQGLPSTISSLDISAIRIKTVNELALILTAIPMTVSSLHLHLKETKFPANELLKINALPQIKKLTCNMFFNKKFISLFPNCVEISLQLQKDMQITFSYFHLDISKMSIFMPWDIAEALARLMDHRTRYLTFKKIQIDCMGKEVCEKFMTHFPKVEKVFVVNDKGEEYFGPDKRAAANYNIRHGLVAPVPSLLQMTSFFVANKTDINIQTANVPAELKDLVSSSKLTKKEKPKMNRANLSL